MVVIHLFGVLALISIAGMFLSLIASPPPKTSSNPPPFPQDAPLQLPLSDDI